MFPVSPTQRILPQSATIRIRCRTGLRAADGSLQRCGAECEPHELRSGCGGYAHGAYEDRRLRFKPCRHPLLPGEADPTWCPRCLRDLLPGAAQLALLAGCCGRADCGTAADFDEEVSDSEPDPDSNERDAYLLDVLEGGAG